MQFSSHFIVKNIGLYTNHLFELHHNKLELHWSNPKNKPSDSSRTNTNRLTSNTRNRRFQLHDNHNIKRRITTKHLNKTKLDDSASTRSNEKKSSKFFFNFYSNPNVLIYQFVVSHCGCLQSNIVLTSPISKKELSAW